MCIEVKQKGSSPFAVVAWYRPPEYSHNNFDELENVLKILDSENKEIILIGDTNCDNLAEEDCKNGMKKRLNELYIEYQFKQLIKNPTRVAKSSATLIDHFSSNQPRRIIDSGIFVTGFSDHNLVFGVRKTVRKARKEPKITKCRQYNKYNPDSFKKDLSKVDWEAILALNNIDAVIEQFE